MSRRVVLVAAALLLGCPGPGARAPTPREPGPTPPASRAWLTVVVEPPGDDLFTAGPAEVARVTGRVQAAARFANRLTMPFPVELRVGACDRLDSHYDREERRITICWEFLAMADKAVPGGAAYVAHFTALHEIAHALIHGLLLTPGVDEEDAADRFAVVTLVEGDDQDQVMAVTATGIFLDRLAAATPEALDEDRQAVKQRGDALLCLALGGSPKLAGAMLAAEPGSPYVDDCRRRFARAKDDWDDMLGRRK